MKLSAKITTVTFLAATALGAAALVGGCTVNSTTSSDTDGGPSSSSGGSSGATSSSGSTTTDGGDTDGGATCDNPKQTLKYEAACQACTEKNCCDKLQACFNQNPSDAGMVDCNAYAECVSTCESGTDPNCKADQCDAVVDQSIKTAFEIMESCQSTNCNAECFE